MSSPSRPLAPPRSQAKGAWSPPQQGSPRVMRDSGPATAFDHRDRAPEDRQESSILSTSAMDAGSQWGWLNAYFSPYDHLVRGSILVDGVNYSAYEAARGKADHKQKALDKALKSDLISEVGCGLMDSDIAVRVSPGAIKSVVLHYEEASSPLLVDADWSIKVDYAMRLRDATLQQAAGAAIYRALTGPYGLHLQHLRSAYASLDPARAGEVGRLVARPHGPSTQQPADPSSGASQCQSSPAPSISRSAPPLPPIPAAGSAGAVVSPTTTAPPVAPVPALIPPPAVSPPPGGQNHAHLQRRSVNPPRVSQAACASPSRPHLGEQYASASPAELRSALDDVRALEAMSSASAQCVRDPPLEAEIATELARDRELASLGEEIAAERRRLQMRISDLNNHHRMS
eukprot:Hpha_TRINITY_DN12964_c0_g1::TRINITY_DN12964_c0_g1_i1::g.164485::m.164485